MEAWQTHVYLHLYHTTTIIPDGSITNTRIFTYIPYNDYYTRWKHDKHTHIYIYTIQRLQYPMEAWQSHSYIYIYTIQRLLYPMAAWQTHVYLHLYSIQRLLYPMESCQTHVYLHLYHTTTAYIPDGSMTNTRIFTFIPYNDYNTRWKHDKHTYIYIYTIQRLQYPMEAWQSHVYLHFYHTTTIITDGSMTNTRIFTFIPYNDYYTRWKHDKHTYIYIYTIQRLQYPMEAWQTRVYLHLYHTTTTIPDGSMTITRIFTFISYNDYYTRWQHHKHMRVFTFIPYNDNYTRWRHDKHKYIYIYTIQRLLYPMEACQTHVYLHLYHTTTTLYPMDSMTNTRIFTFIPYNDYNTRWKHDKYTYIYIYIPYNDYNTRWQHSQTHVYLHLYHTTTIIPDGQHHKHTYIYIYTIQRLLYPMAAWQTHVYLHLYHTTTIIPDGSMTNTRIFTFIPYNDYYTRWKHDKHTYIYIYTIQRLQYPMEAWQTHVYLHLYHTTTTIPDGSMTNTRIFTFIPYNDYNTRWKHDKHTYIYIYTIQRLQYPMEAWQTHVYLHLYHTTTYNTRWKHDKHTYIYIYTIQRLQYPMEAWQSHVYLHLYSHTTTIITDGSIHKHTYIYIYTIQRLLYPMEAWQTHAYIYIYTIQRLQYPMEAWQHTRIFTFIPYNDVYIPDGSMTNTRIFTFIPNNDYYTRWKSCQTHAYIFVYILNTRRIFTFMIPNTHVYLHLYHTTTTIPDGSMTITRIFTFIPYNDYYTRWQQHKHTYIYIYTIQRLQYPMSWQSHVYLHLYHTTTIIPDGSITNTRIFTFIPYNDYYTRWQHDKHTYIYIYTIQRLQYPMEAWQTHVYLDLYHTRLQYTMEAWQSHVYLHLYHTTTIIPDVSNTNTRIFTFIPYNDCYTRWRHDKDTYIYIYTIQRLLYPMAAWQTHIYLHLYHTTTTIPDVMTITRIFTFIPYNDYYNRWKHDKHTYIYIYAIQRLLYPMEAWQTHVYLHLYHTATTIPDGSMTNTRIFTFIPYNDNNTRWKHDKHTYIYIYTKQRLQYPMEAWQTHVYLHLYHTTTTIPDGSMTITRIFTFIPYNDYYTRWQQHKHTHIYIYTIQRLLYPMDAWQTHVYLHLYHTTTIIPDGSMTNTRIFTFIPYNDYNTRWKHDKHTHIYIYTIQRLLYPVEAWQSQVYLYLCHTRTIIPDGSMTNTRIFTFIPYNDYYTRWRHVKHTYIYIYTIQRLQYPMEAWQTHVYLHLYHTTTTIPDGSMTITRIFIFIPYNDYYTRWQHHKHTYIYIYTIQRLLYPMEAWQTHVYLHLYHTTTIIPDGSMTNTLIFTFIPYTDYYNRWKHDKHTYIYIYTIQRLQYPMEAWETHVYLHLYHTTTAIADGSMTNTRIFTFIPYNDYNTRWKHDKHTYIYIYTIQRLQYPMEAWQSHVYLYLYHTTTIIPDGSITNTRIFTFIPYNDYYTRWKHDKHTYIFIYTIQRLLYPMEAWQTHLYLHLYHTPTIITDGSMTNTRIFTFIPYNDYNTRWKHEKHTYIYIYTIQRLQ